MIKRVTAALGLGLVFVAFLLQGTGRAAPIGPGFARFVVYDAATNALAPVGAAPARRLWPEHFPSLLPAHALPSQGATQSMGASSDGPVEVDAGEYSGVQDDGPIDDWAELTPQEQQAAIDRLLSDPSSVGSGDPPISNFELEIPSLPTSPVTEVELPEIRLKTDEKPSASRGTGTTTPPAGASGAAATKSISTEGTVDISSRSTSNFELDISSLPTDRVSKVSWTKSGEVTISMPMRDYEDWRAWVENHVIRGDTEDGRYGALSFLGTDLTTVTGSIEFDNLVPVSIDLKPATGGGEKLAEFVVTLQAGTMRVSTPDKSGASSGTTPGVDSGASRAGAIAPDVSRTSIPSRIRSAISEAQQSGVSDSVIRSTLLDELFNPDLTPRNDLPRALLAIEERLAVEASLLGVVDPVELPFAMSGVSGRGAYAPLEVLVTSIGGSTGKVLDMYVVNNGKAPAQVDFEGMVLEPVEDLTAAQRERIRQVMAAASAGKDPDDIPFALSWRPLVPRAGSFLLMSSPATLTSALHVLSRRPVAPTVQQLSVTKVTLEAYCLEFEAGVPGEGVVFRIADRTTQESHAPMRSILSASRRRSGLTSEASTGRNTKRPSSSTRRRTSRRPPRSGRTISRNSSAT